LGLIVPIQKMLANFPSFLSEIEAHLERDVIPYWRARAVDPEHGGFRTNFDPQGSPLPCPEKYLNTQCRMIWWFSTLCRRYPNDARYGRMARDGVDFLVRHFWDNSHGGWYWKTYEDGSPLDTAKIAYGQSFAIYALSQYADCVGDPLGLEYAARTFDLLQKYASDTLYGGYLENLDALWEPFIGDEGGANRKGLDTHMHLMEAYTGLYAISAAEVHRRKLLELVELIRTRMVNAAYGCGRNQLDAAWNPLPAVAIMRTWNAERNGPGTAQPLDTTSYGHNVELSWLMHRALDAAQVDPTPYLPLTRALIEHAIRDGVDWESGGIFRDGLPGGPAITLEKEFWQQAEALVGFIDAYQRFSHPRCLEAAECVWRFIRDHMAASAGEWRTLMSRDGRTAIDANLGNPWKGPYHTGRALTESVDRLRTLRSTLQPPADGSNRSTATIYPVI
jgi:cellobiose epimerase